MDLVEEEHASAHVDIESGGADQPEIPPALEPGLCCSVSPARERHPGALASVAPEHVASEVDGHAVEQRSRDVRGRGSARGERDLSTDGRRLELGVVLDPAGATEAIRDDDRELTDATFYPILERERLERGAADHPREDGAACVTACVGALVLGRRAVDVVREVDRLARGGQEWWKVRDVEDGLRLDARRPGAGDRPRRGADAGRDSEDDP
jgi:hypothetical protein